MITCFYMVHKKVQASLSISLYYVKDSDYIKKYYKPNGHQEQEKL